MTICWDVATGARKDSLTKTLFFGSKVVGQSAFPKAGIGRYIVTKKGDLILVYDTRGDVVNADGEEKVLAAFFRAPSPITIVSCAGDKIAVCCENLAVLTLHAPWLTAGGAA